MVCTTLSASCAGLTIDAAPPSQAVLILPLQSIMDCQVKPGNDSEEVGRPCTERNAVQHGPDNADIVWWLFATE
jgi:hypothetical protein